MTGLFSTPKPAKIPPPPPVTPLIDPEDPAFRARKRRAAAQKISEGQATVLSDVSDRETLG